MKVPVIQTLKATHGLISIWE